MEERLRTMEERLQSKSSTEEQLQRENEALKTTVEMMQAKLESLQSIKEARQVAFSASLSASGSGHTGPFSSVESALIYRKVSANFGNGYNSETGIFTAPLKGVYYFRFYAHCHTGNKMAVSLYKNDKVQCSVFSERPWTNGNASNGIVLILEKGDQIYTKLWDESWVYDDPASYTSFGGFLLFPL
ncbi:collagen alpha-1(VIII) chain-like [Colossoma macropomum]|uniref:collagen alpha-1(VIII) chain-like n=1 Tax=Colossoma macropomum TaxID=42526 RepID=UPI0018641ED2|nr:collagen alpha-1(VIII) chain-like [Colossoma macropomum]